MTGASRFIAGVVLLTIVTIQIGGWFMTKIARGDVPMTDFQKSFARPGTGMPAYSSFSPWSACCTSTRPG